MSWWTQKGKFVTKDLHALIPDTKTKTISLSNYLKNLDEEILK